MKKLFAFAALLAAAVLLGTAFSAGNTVSVKAESAQASDTVTVSGKATVYVTPDKAEINVGVQTIESTAAKSQQKNTEDVNKVLEALKKLGIDEKSIRTTGYNMYQMYDYEKDEISGYNVTTYLTIKNLDIDKAGDVLSEAVSAGANQMYGISYTCSTYDKAYEEALSAAVEAAKTKAAVLAKAAGRSLGDVQSLVEGWQDTSARYSSSNVMMEAAAIAEDAGAGISIMPGESEIEADVTVSWYLN